MPFEVLTAITHAQERLNYIFTKEDFKEGKVGSMMVAIDFDFEEVVSLPFYILKFVYYLPLILYKLKFAVQTLIFVFIRHKKNLSSAQKEQFQEQIKTLSGTLKVQFDKANKEYKGTQITQTPAN